MTYERLQINVPLPAVVRDAPSPATKPLRITFEVTGATLDPCAETDGGIEFALGTPIYLTIRVVVE